MRKIYRSIELTWRRKQAAGQFWDSSGEIKVCSSINWHRLHQKYHNPAMCPLKQSEVYHTRKEAGQKLLSRVVPFVGSFPSINRIKLSRFWRTMRQSKAVRHNREKKYYYVIGKRSNAFPERPKQNSTKRNEVLNRTLPSKLTLISSSWTRSSPMSETARSLLRNHFTANKNRKWTFSRDSSMTAMVLISIGRLELGIL